MSVIKIANLSSNVEYFQVSILSLVEEIGSGRLTKKQAEALKSIKSYATSSREDAAEINKNASSLAESALKGVADEG